MSGLDLDRLFALCVGVCRVSISFMDYSDRVEPLQSEFMSVKDDHVLLFGVPVEKYHP